MSNSRYNIEIEVVTPLCVGTGNERGWTRRADFVEKDGIIFVFDVKKLAEYAIHVKGASKSNIDELMSIFSTIDKLSIDQLKSLSKYEYPSPCKDSFFRDIKTILRSQYNDIPLIAGSSIKGAIRSALFKHFRSENEDNNTVVFGDMKVGTDFMRFIQVSDVEMPSNKIGSKTIYSTGLVNTRLFNLYKVGNDWYGGWKNKITEVDEKTKEQLTYTTEGLKENVFNNVYECIKPGWKGTGSISIKKEVFNLLAQKEIKRQTGKKIITHQTEKKKLLNEGNRLLFGIINKQTKNYLVKEKAFFEKYRTSDKREKTIGQNNRAQEICANIGRLIKMIDMSDGSYCLMKMAAGVGFHSISGDWQDVSQNYADTKEWTAVENPKLAGRKKYKSRRIAIYGGKLQLMGIVKITDLSIALEKQNTQNKYQEIIVEAKELLKAMKLEEARKKAKEAEKIFEEGEDHQPIIKEVDEKRYKALNKEARDLLDIGNLKEARNKANEAAIILRDGKEHELIIQTIDKYSKPYAQIINSTKYANTIASTTEKWLQYNNRTFGDTEYTALSGIVKSMSDGEKGKLKKNKKFEEVITSAWMNKLFPKPQTQQPLKETKQPEKDKIVKKTLRTESDIIVFESPQVPIDAERPQQEATTSEIKTQKEQVDKNYESKGIINNVLKWFKNLFK